MINFYGNKIRSKFEFEHGCISICGASDVLADILIKIYNVKIKPNFNCIGLNCVIVAVGENAVMND